METWTRLLTCAVIFCIAHTGLAQFSDESCGGNENCTATVVTPCCDIQSLMCVECCADSYCPPELGNPTFCNVLTHTCVECKENDDCPPTMPVCNQMHSCEIECDLPTDCSSNETCNNGQCVCSNDMDPCNDDHESCDENGNCVCDDGFLQDMVSGDCVSDCDPACTGGKICTRTRMCICPGGTEEALNGTCLPCDIECRVSSDCPNEGEICNSEFHCECPAGVKLFRGRCTKPGRLGGQCKSGRCRGRGVVCNRSTNMCMCRRGCETEPVCLKKRW